MNLNSIINRIVGLFVRKAVNKGIDYAARGGKPASKMTPAERSQSQKAREMTKRARKAASITRKLGR